MPQSRSWVFVTFSLVALISACIGDAGFSYPLPSASTAPLATISASPDTVSLGEHTIITWSSDATDARIDGIGAVNSSGSQDVAPLQTTTYTLVASGPGGTTIKFVEVVVVLTPTLGVTTEVTPRSGSIPFTTTLTSTLSGSAFGTARHIINWGDGTKTDTVTNKQAQNVRTHLYQTAGDFVVSDRVTRQGTEAVSAPVTVSASGASLRN